MANTSNNGAQPAAPLPPAARKGKGKKNTDPVDTNKLLEQTMARLERDVAGDKEQEAEIEREVKKANRDLTQHLNGYKDPLARVNEIQKRFTTLVGEMKRLERDHQKSKKRADQLQKEKDTAKSELSKATSLKEKLEKLSRETSNENRKLRADVQQLRDVESKMREELHDRLEQMVLDVEDVIDSSNMAEESQETLETDELFKSKFKSFVDQYELRELHFQATLRQRDLEILAHIAMLEQQRKTQEMESSKSHQLTRQVSTFSQTETELRSQLNIYVEKFKQVEDTLNNSNDLFLTFRREMEEMSKKTKRLEKENLTLSRKHEATNQNIVKMAEERQRTHKELDLLRRQNANLEKLCRGMQAQGRGQVNMALDQQQGQLDGAVDDEGTESEYEEDDDAEYEDESGEEESYDDDTEEERVEANAVAGAQARKPFGPVPPPPQVNGANGSAQPPNGHPRKSGQPPQAHLNGQQQQLNGIKA
ncbi:hypothetical protein BLS_003624 [Venturia inaequalis]|uniref:Alpha-taxilin n=1 Tax=Venturia inaequalis TaxID=5025 RepID=A0A8H3UAC8_VENIN|nr:hypothetical protein EG328_009216 [Venturia inaequalis]KAE9973362.1 hypothetical protein BLS_003624 [Venturia inaequalis]RDI79635.1 hypothetical protein Vi05172_g10417 [Venturia inaequalis]